jgi:hypothetical protein
MIPMTNSDDIHQAIIDEALDLEAIEKDEKISVGDVVRNLAKHPLQILFRWNWKAALLGAIFRASFYFGVYNATKEGWMVTLTAVLVEFGFRLFTAGISGSIVQSFRRATPQWLATAVVTISLPIFSHTIEFFTHFAQERFFSDVFPAAENNSRQKAFAVSVLLSILSAMFTLFILRKGVLLVGAGKETKSLWSDIKSFPMLIIEFMAFLPTVILDFIKSRDFLYAIGIFVAFGVAVGSVMGIFRGKLSWGIVAASISWGVLLFGTIIMRLIRYFSKPAV